MNAPRQVKVQLCAPCAAKLKAIVEERGEEAMGREFANVLCKACTRAIPGYAPGRRLTTSFKGRLS